MAIRLFWAKRNEVLSLHRLDIALHLGLSVALPISISLQRAVDQIQFLQIIVDCQVDAVAALMAWMSMATLEWKELAKLEMFHTYIIIGKQWPVSDLTVIFCILTNHATFGPMLKEKLLRFIEH